MDLDRPLSRSILSTSCVAGSSSPTNDVLQGETFFVMGTTAQEGHQGNTQEHGQSSGAVDGLHGQAVYSIQSAPPPSNDGLQQNIYHYVINTPSSAAPTGAIISSGSGTTPMDTYTYTVPSLHTSNDGVNVPPSTNGHEQTAVGNAAGGSNVSVSGVPIKSLMNQTSSPPENNTDPGDAPSMNDPPSNSLVGSHKETLLDREISIIQKHISTYIFQLHHQVFCFITKLFLFNLSIKIYIKFL